MNWKLGCLPLVLAAVLSCGCGRSGNVQAVAAEPKIVVVPVTVAPVAVRPSARMVSLVGTLYGDQEVTLSSQVDGQIRALNVDLGDAVAMGQAVAQIDDDQWRARLRETEAMLAKAEADESRGRQLAGAKIISPQEYDAVKTGAAVARAQRDSLKVMIRHARVESPLEGAVAKRFVSAGEYVHGGSPLFTLVAQDPLKLRGDVPERFAHELQVGQSVQVRVDAFPDRPFTGRLSRISPASNPDNRSVSIEAVVDNHDRALKPGFFANAAVITRTDDRALIVPQEAVVTFAGVTKLFVVKDGTACERQVRLGTRGTAGMVEIVEGVDVGDLVITSGLSKVENGIAVSFKEAAAANRDSASS